MGGGGFMHHAASTNRKDRAQRDNRRKKFNGNFSQDTILDGIESEKIEFPELPKEQITFERKKIQERHAANRKRNVILISVFIVLSLSAIGVLYSITDGFEHWETLN